MGPSDVLLLTCVVFVSGIIVGFIAAIVFLEVRHRL
jgi:hypothetical protein